MPRILCTLPNASTLINGIPFIADQAGMLSGEVDTETAEHFSRIPGYAVVQQPAQQSITTDSVQAAVGDIAAPVAESGKSRRSRGSE